MVFVLYIAILVLLLINLMAFLDWTRLRIQLKNQKQECSSLKEKIRDQQAEIRDLSNQKIILNSLLNSRTKNQ